MRLLLDWFQHPEKNFYPIIIAGTKGKGSTGFFLESILREAKISVGFYVSPHIETPRERIRIQGQIISEKEWVSALKRIKATLKKNMPALMKMKIGELTYFEVMTLMAAEVFAARKVQVAIFEVGMGGRCDATNIFDAKISILTPIHLDHEAILGNTIAKIAAEKVEVVRPRADVVVAPQTSEAKRVIDAKIKAVLAKAHWVKTNAKRRVGLIGEFQKINAECAARAAELIATKEKFDLSKSVVEKALLRAQWPGRMEIVAKSPYVMIDAAHNPTAAKALVGSLAKVFSEQKKEAVLVFGTSRDKNSAQMLKILSGYFRRVVFTRAQNSRSAEISSLVEQGRSLFDTVYVEINSDQALITAKRLVGSKGLVVVTGSFFLIGEIRKKSACSIL